MSTPTKRAYLMTLQQADEIFGNTDQLVELAGRTFSQVELNELHWEQAGILGLQTYELPYDEQVSHTGTQYRLSAVITGNEFAERYARLLNFRVKIVDKGDRRIIKFEIRHGAIKVTDGLLAGDDRKQALAMIAQVPFFEIQTGWLNRLSDGTEGFNLILTPRWPKNPAHAEQLARLAEKGNPALTIGKHNQLLVDTSMLKVENQASRK